MSLDVKTFGVVIKINDYVQIPSFVCHVEHDRDSKDKPLRRFEQCRSEILAMPDRMAAYRRTLSRIAPPGRLSLLDLVAVL